MDAATLFQVCNDGVIPFWLLLAFAPRWIWTRRIVHALWLPLAFASVYALAIAASLGAPDSQASFTSLAGVMALFDSPEGALAGWVHYLVFDLFIGAWQVRDAQRRGIPHLAVIPCLFLTLMLGPLGLALYLLMRAALRRIATLEEDGPAPA